MSMHLIVASLLAISAVQGRSALEYRATPQLYSSCINSNDIALTFDDGPYIYLRNISDQFTAAGAKATFFMNGNNWDCIYNADRISDVKYAYAAGHMIGSHTWAHGDLTTFSSAQIEDAMYRMEEAFSRILGIKAAFMRPPYGNYNSNIQSIAAGRGAESRTSEAVYNSIASAKPKNALILEHETEETTATKLVPYAIKLFQGLGYNLVTMADCLGVDPYQAIGVAQEQTSAWTCDGTPAPGEGCSGSITCETGTALFNSATGSGPTGTSTPAGTRPSAISGGPAPAASPNVSGSLNPPSSPTSGASKTGSSTPTGSAPPSNSNPKPGGSQTSGSSSQSSTPSGKTGGAQGMTVPVGALVGTVGLMMLL
ncbi:hypothetical protein MVEN_01695500 [Mycena venus]|uniref:NodB homology domain-containing protein n=1 Tax=Mycena venus TaxID=2733690 RepID=A0A8H6XPM0_9AGAR|nr:hypothetical protein MVEN_01695500 [Mycena venus]